MKGNLKRIISVFLSLSVSASGAARCVFAADGGYIIDNPEARIISINDTDEWPWCEYDLGGSYTILPGAVVEYDVTVESAEFTQGLYIETDFNWASVKGEYFTADAFTDNTVHVSHIYEDAAKSEVTAIEIKSDNRVDYRGGVTITDLKVTNGTEVKELKLSGGAAFCGEEISFPSEGEYSFRWYRSASAGGEASEIDGAGSASYVPAEYDLGGWIYCVRTGADGEEKSDPVPVFASHEKKTTTLYSGAARADGEGLAAPIYLSQNGYKFNAGMIAPGGEFRVSFSGGAEDAELCFSDWATGKWAQAKPSELSGDTAVFDYEACKTAYGADFAGLSAIWVYTKSGAEINSIEWVGYDSGEVMHVIPWTPDDSMTAADDQTSVGYVYTKHVGGEFDTTKITEDGAFWFVYEGTAENEIYLSVSSYSSGDEARAKAWCTVYPTESGSLGGGRYWSKISAADMRAAFGDNFGRLDHFGLYIKNGVTVKMSGVHLYYVGGTGAAIETAPEDTMWTNKMNKDGGIAFIGDSIVHNPLVNSSVGLNPDKGDWNAILGRENCDNYGIGGETSAHIADRFYQLLDEDCNYSQIVTLFGINDVGLEANDEMVIERVIGNYTKVLDMVSQSPKKPAGGMFVLSLLPSTPATYEGTQERIVKVNAALSELCGKYDFATFVNVYDALKYNGEEMLEGCINPGEPHGDPIYFMPDGLHPIAAGYAKIAEILNPALGGEWRDPSDVPENIVSWDFNSGINGWTYGGEGWSNGGTSDGSLRAEDKMMRVDIKFKKTDWSQGAVTYWSDNGIDISDKDTASFEMLLEKAAYNSGGGTLLARLYGSTKEDNSTITEETVRIPISSDNVVTVGDKEYYKAELNIGFDPSEKPLNNLGLIFIGRNSTFDGTILIDNLSLYKRGEDGSALTPVYVDSGSSGGGGGGGGGGTSVSLPYTWRFGSTQESWTYGKGWETDYSGAGRSSAGWNYGMLSVTVDFSADKAKSWSQMAVTLWNDNGMNLYGANHASIEFIYDPEKADGGFKLKLYSNSGIDSLASIDPSKAEDITVGGKTLKKVHAEFGFAPVDSRSTRDLAVCVIGVNTSYKGALYLDDITISKGADMYVSSTKRAAAKNSVVKASGGALKTASGETLTLAGEARLVDGAADAEVGKVYAYLEAMGRSKDVLFGQQNNIVSKAGAKSLSDADTYDVVGDYAAIYGIDTLALTGNEFSAKQCNEKYKTNFSATAAGNVQAAAYVANKAADNGSIVTLSAHMPNFSEVKIINPSASDYSKYDFGGYTPNNIGGDVMNELLPGGEYNEIYNAYLDMIAEFASQVKGAVLFRPYHENTGSWFWWGKAYCDPSTYQNVYRYTVEYLRDIKGVHNFLYAYSPSNTAETVEDYAERYPGDEYVDMVGFDMYNSDPDPESGWMDDFKKQVEITCEFAKLHGKLAAVSETGIANATADGDNQTALLKTGNKDKDWFNRVLDIVSDSDASYFMVWANFGEADGFYTPYVVKKNSDGTLYGHEMLDNFIDYYNDPRSVFASDQKTARAAVPGAAVKPAADGATGYITAPISGRRVLDATDFAARLTNAGDAEVSFVLRGDGGSLTLNAKTEDGVYYTASLSEAELEALGVSADGSAELLIDGETRQTIKLIYNIAPPADDPRLVDNFDDYYGVEGLMTKVWTTGSAPGDTSSIALDQSVKYNGGASLRFDYSIGKNGYAGTTKSKNADWSDCNALSLWTVPDDTPRITVIQITAGGKVYEAYLNEYDEYESASGAISVTIPFSEFALRDEVGKPRGGLLTDRAAVTEVGVWVDSVRDDRVSGTLYYDDIRAVSGAPDTVTVTEAESAEFFSDVAADAWYHDSVRYVFEKNIMSGTGGGKFEPDAPMTRAMLAQVLYNLEGGAGAESAGFGDVKADAWYAGAVDWAAEKGVVTGYSPESFGPENRVTREQMAVMLYRYAAADAAGAELSDFADAETVSEWAYDAVAWAVSEDIINGTDGGAIAPTENATRAQLAAVLMRFCEGALK